MSFIIELDNFQGPFDVLLDLLATKELAITELSLSQVTNDYLEYITKIELELEEMNWFLFVATKLTYNKSVAILAIQQPEQELDLTSALQNYAKIKNQAKIIAEQSKNPLYNRISVALTRPVKLCGTDELLNIYSVVLKSYIQKPVNRTINSKSNRIKQIRGQFLKHISKLRDFNSSEVLRNSKSRTEAAIYLLTLLDLLHKGELTLLQDKYSLVGVK